MIEPSKITWDYKFEKTHIEKRGSLVTITRPFLSEYVYVLGRFIILVKVAEENVPPGIVSSVDGNLYLVSLQKAFGHPAYLLVDIDREIYYCLETYRKEREPHRLLAQEDILKIENIVPPEKMYDGTTLNNFDGKNGIRPDYFDGIDWLQIKKAIIFFNAGNKIENVNTTNANVIMRQDIINFCPEKEIIKQKLDNEFQFIDIEGEI